jgi:hypothetical protein
VRYLNRSRSAVADEYGEVHVRFRVPDFVPAGQVVLLVVVGQDPASVDTLLFTVRKGR